MHGAAKPIAPFSIEASQRGCGDGLTSTSRPELTKRHANVFQCRPCRIQADLKDVELVPHRLAAELGHRPPPSPQRGQIFRHANGELPVLREQQVDVIRVSGEQLLHLDGCGDDLHRVHAVEAGSRVEADDLRLRQGPPLVRCEPSPFSLRGAFRPAVHRRWERSPPDRERHVVDMILPGPLGLEDDISELTVNLDAHRVLHTLPSRRVDHPHRLLLWIRVSTSPGNVSPDRVRLYGDAHARTMVSPPRVPRLLSYAPRDTVRSGRCPRNRDTQKYHGRGGQSQVVHSHLLNGAQGPNLQGREKTEIPPLWLEFSRPDRISALTSSRSSSRAAGHDVYGRC